MNKKNNHHEIFELLPGLVFGLVFCALILTIVQSAKDTESWISFSFSAYGTLLSGIGTIGLLFLAIYQIPRELEKFRAQQEHQAKLERERLNYQANFTRSLRMSERIELVAAETLEAVYGLIGAIQHLSNPFSFSGEGETEKAKKDRNHNESDSDKTASEKFLLMFNSRFETVRDDIQNFYKAKVKARIFLDSKTNDKIKEIESKYHEVRRSAAMHSMGLASVGEDRKSSAYKRAYETYYDFNDERANFLELKKKEIEDALKIFIHPTL